MSRQQYLPPLDGLRASFGLTVLGAVRGRLGPALDDLRQEQSS
jgi:hypothetical protein